MYNKWNFKQQPIASFNFYIESGNYKTKTVGGHSRFELFSVPKVSVN